MFTQYTVIILPEINITCALFTTHNTYVCYEYIT